MKRLILPFVMIPLTSWSQDFVKDIEALNQKVSQDEIDRFVNPGPEKKEKTIPGDFISSMLPKRTTLSEICDETESKKTHYEVVLVAEANSKNSSTEILPGQHSQFKTNDLKLLIDGIPETEKSKGLSSDAVLQRATDIWKSGWFNPPSTAFDPKSAIGKELFIEGLVQAAAKSDLKENDLTKSMATIIGKTYESKVEKKNMLNALSLRLYRNYNTARNPGYDNKKNNPFGAELPTGDLTANDMLKAAANFDVFKGVVCNDVSETVVMVGTHLLPDEDVLAVNGGTHFGVVISDGKSNYVIDGGDEYQLKNKLLLDKKMSPTNLRISRMNNGALEQIAVVDTELGQLAEATFQTGKKLLKTDADISSLVSHYKKRNATVGMGVGHLSDSNVVIVIAKYETAGDKWKSYVGGGLSSQIYLNDQNTKYQVHLRAGAERTMLRYVNNSTVVNVSSGVKINGMYTLNPVKAPLGISKVDMSVGLDVINRVDVNYGKHNRNGVQVRGSLETEHSVGVKNWGATTGALSYMNPGDTGTILKNMNLHLNQVNVQVNVEKKLTKSLDGIVQGNYQGSQVGQAASIIAGLNIKAPEGAQILVFTGYTDSSLKGYKTKHSLLSKSQDGVQTGVKYTSKKGLEVNGAVRSISGKPSVNATLKVPFK
jgi:hypothetical protein